jgi:hypothetical protein
MNAFAPRIELIAAARRARASDLDNSQMRHRPHHTSSLPVTSVNCVWFSFLFPDMKPRLVSDASGILFRVAEFQIGPI